MNEALALALAYGLCREWSYTAIIVARDIDVIQL